jgi:ubiquinone/menaquinone biosynthesis C-methylase UbiE
VDVLLASGVSCVAVLDVSSAALERARRRLGSLAQRVEWIEADVTRGWSVSPRDIWHDRAVFHFLVEQADRAAYLARLRTVLKPGGSVVLATFAPTGPERCSGLPVHRYDAASLGEQLGPEFVLAETLTEAHRTPTGTIQDFTYCRFVRTARRRE